MTMTVNLHNVTAMMSDGSNGVTWLHIFGGHGEKVTLFVDGKLAEMLEEAFNEYHDWLSGQEGPTFEDALSAKCAAMARDDEARAMK